MVKFGYQMDSRDASSGAVASMYILFCRRFGREVLPELLAAGKRGPVSSVKYCIVLLEALEDRLVVAEPPKAACREVKGVGCLQRDREKEVL
jgi:hypothetical protein